MKSEDIAAMVGGCGHKPPEQHLTGPPCLGQFILVEDLEPWEALISTF